VAACFKRDTQCLAQNPVIVTKNEPHRPRSSWLISIKEAIG
jgi:hypothetical protein